MHIPAGIVIRRSKDGTKAVTAYFIKREEAKTAGTVSFAEEEKGSGRRHLTRQN